MKKNLLLVSTLFFIGCSSSTVTDCPDCVKAPTTVLIPNSHNSITPNIQLEEELNKNLEAQQSVAETESKSEQKQEPSVEQANKTKAGAQQGSLSERLSALSVLAKEKWGEEGYIQSSKHRYVKYLDDYSTRADIQFDKGKIVIASISASDTTQKLQNAIVQVLLMPQHPKNIDLFASQPIEINNPNDNLLLFGQVLDQDTTAIQWEWRARRFAKHLVTDHLQQQQYAKGIAQFVEINMVEDHLAIREKNYASSIESIANQYALPKELISAIIKTESSFNPFSVTSTGSLGIMQIVPNTAGADVFKQLKNSDTIPSLDYAFDPKNNIDLGTAYLNIIYNKYLSKISNPTSRYFAMISAYNSGTKIALSTFDLDPEKAVQKINQTDPKEVYQYLITQHPNKAARSYLEAVLSAQNNFDLNAV